MSHPLRHRLAGLAATASLPALLLAGSAHAQPVRIFEQPPPIELLRSIMVPESQPGLSRRIVITNPERPAPLAAPAAMVQPESSAEPAPAPVRQPRWRQPAPEPGPVFASTQASPPPAAPAAMPAAEAPPAEPAAEAGIVGFRINFALDSDVVPRNAYPFIDRMAELLREQPQIRLQVQGHTDALGPEEYNLDLSRRRANAVAAYLEQRPGIDPARLVVIGFGEEAPLTANPYDPRNRRVQFARAD